MHTKKTRVSGAANMRHRRQTTHVGLWAHRGTRWSAVQHTTGWTHLCNARDGVWQFVAARLGATTIDEVFTVPALHHREPGPGREEQKQREGNGLGVGTPYMT